MSNLNPRKWRLIPILAALVAMLALSVSSAGANHTFHITVKHQINGHSAGAILAGDPQALPKELPVDVYVNGNLTIEDYEFGDFIETDLPAGNYELAVTLANDSLSNAIMSFGPTEIPAGVDVTVTAKLINQSPTLAVKVK
jgi:hypothetical protein